MSCVDFNVFYYKKIKQNFKQKVKSKCGGCCDGTKEIVRTIPERCVCPCPPPKPKPKPTGPTCGILIKSGGNGFYKYDLDLTGHPAGEMEFYSDAYGVPDKFVVKHGDEVLLDTGFKSGVTKIKLKFDPSKGPIVTLEITGNLNSGTAWEAKLGCPVPV